MPAPATVDEFVDLIRKSAVLEEARLSAYVQKIKTDPAAPKDLSSIAGLFIRDGLLTFFQAEQFLQGKWKRFTIGKYKVLERLGSGGMGQVFLCEHKLMRRRVAVKVLPTQKAADPSSLDRFYREARAVAALDHPNIVRAYDIDQDDNLHFLVMEYVDGASMQEMIRKSGPMDPNRACHYMYWSAVGLQHAHAAGLIHRDIKPGNILVDRQGVVKILDLGLARFFNDDEDQLTKKYDESVLGTADYLAPEQAVDSHGVDGRADIYSLGATFYFLLTGQPPFAEGSVAQKLMAHQNRSPKPVREVRSEVPEQVARIVTKMMAKKPEDRYQTPDELAEALLPLTQTPIPPPPDEEMPTLSAAAQGTNSGQVPALAPSRPMPAPRTPPPVAGSKAPPSGPKPAGTGPKPASGPPAPTPVTSKPGTGVAVAEADTQRNQPGPVVEPIPDSVPGTPIWETISADTANNSRVDTDRKKRDASSRRIKPAPKSATGKSAVKAAKPGKLAGKRRFSLPLIIAVACGLLVLGAAVTFAVYRLVRDKGDKTTGSQVSTPRKLILTKNPAGALQYPSLEKALKEFKPGDTIVIQDDEWEESVGVSRVKNLTITAAEGKRVTWRGPPNKNENSILSLTGTEGARIAGITFVANPKIDHAVRLDGFCPGLVLEDVVMQDAGVASLALHDCCGERSRQVVIRNCRIAGQGGRAGILFQADPSKKDGFPAQGSQSVVILNCLVEAPASGSGIVFEGSAAADIRHCRFWKGTTGVQFRKAIERPSDLGWQVNMTGNTFHSQVSAGIWIEDAAQLKGGGWNRITIAQNFFAVTPVAIKVDGDASGAKFLQIDANNVRKPSTQPGQAQNFPLPPMIETADDVVIDPSNPSRLLTYDKSSPLMKAANGKPAGAPPE